MRPPRFRIRTLMIVVALLAALLALAAIGLREIHVHDFYMSFD